MPGRAGRPARYGMADAEEGGLFQVAETAEEIWQEWFAGRPKAHR